MKWKSDSIEQFVKYKIQHPEESLMTLKNYQMQKKQNEHLQKLSKQVEKLKGERDYFHNELMKLNRIAQMEGKRNYQQIKRIQEKCELLSQKIYQLKEKKNSMRGKTKEEIIAEYQSKLQQTRETLQQELEQKDKTLNQLKQQLHLLHASGYRDNLIQKITLTSQQIEHNRALNGQRYNKIKKIRTLQEKLIEKNLHLQESKKEISKRKEIIADMKKKQEDNEIKDYEEMKERTQKLTEQLFQYVKNKLLGTSKSLDDKEPFLEKTFSENLALQSQSSKEQNSTEQLMFNPHIDFSYSKKKISSPQKIMNQNEENNLMIDKVSVVQNSIDDFKEFLNRLKEDYHVEDSQIQNDGKDKINQQQTTNEEAISYLQSKFNHHPQVNLPLQMDSIIEQMRNQIHSYRTEYEQSFNKQAEKLTEEQSLLDQKEKQLDKEIQHLQKKVQKTQLQITKKNRTSG